MWGMLMVVLLLLLLLTVVVMVRRGGRERRHGEARPIIRSDFPHNTVVPIVIPGAEVQAIHGSGAQHGRLRLPRLRHVDHEAREFVGAVGKFV